MNKVKTLLMSISICLIIAVMGLSTALVLTMPTNNFSGSVTASIASIGVVGSVKCSANHRYIQSYNEMADVITYGNKVVQVNNSDSAVITYTGSEAQSTKSTLTYADTTLRYGESVEYNFEFANDSTNSTQYVRMYLDLGKTSGSLYVASEDMSKFSYKAEYWWTNEDGTLSPYYVLDVKLARATRSNYSWYQYSGTTLKTYTNNNGSPQGEALSTITITTSTSQYNNNNEFIYLCTSNGSGGRSIYLDKGCKLHAKYTIGFNASAASLYPTKPGSFDIGYYSRRASTSDYFGF